MELAHNLIVQATPVKVFKEGCLSPVTPVQGPAKSSDAEQVAPTTKRRHSSQAFTAKTLEPTSETADDPSVQKGTRKGGQGTLQAPVSSFSTPSPVPPPKKRSRAQLAGPSEGLVSRHVACGIPPRIPNPPSFQHLQLTAPQALKATRPAGCNLLERLEAAKLAPLTCGVDSLLCDEVEFEAQGQELLPSSSRMPAPELGNGEADQEEEEEQEEEEQELKPLAVRKTVMERVPSLAQWMSRLTGASNEDPVAAKPAEPLKGAVHFGGLGAVQQEMPKKSLLDRMIEQLEADDAEQTDSEVETDANDADSSDETISKQLKERQEQLKKSMAGVILERLDSMIPNTFDGTSKKGLLKSSSFSFC